MTELSFATTVDEEKNQSSDDEEYEATENETADIYISLGDAVNTAAKPLKAMPVPDGAEYTEDGSLTELKIYKDDDLEDVERLLDKYEDAEPQQKLHMVLALAKSTFGDRTANLNDHGIGLNNDGEPNVDGSRPSYADHYRNLEAINWQGLNEPERNLLEDIVVDVSNIGFDPKQRGPKLLVAGGKRLPVLATEGGEHEEALSVLAALPESPSYHEDLEEDLVESSDPSVFDDEADVSSDKGGGSIEDTDMSIEDDGEDPLQNDLQLASNPERITEASTTQLKSGVNNLTNITNSRVLMKMKSHEQNNENRSTVVDRLEQRINAEGNYGGDEEDSDDSEAVSEADSEADSEEVEVTIEDINEMFDFNEIEQDALSHKVNNGMSPKDAAKQIADL
jgi:hypothetical protein